MNRNIGAVALLILAANTLAVEPSEYTDGRPAVTLRMDAEDHGVVLRHGDGPNQCDQLGARDVWVFEERRNLLHALRCGGPQRLALFIGRQHGSRLSGRRKAPSSISENLEKTIRRPPPMASPTMTANGGTCSISERPTYPRRRIWFRRFPISR